MKMPRSKRGKSGLVSAGVIAILLPISSQCTNSIPVLKQNSPVEHVVVSRQDSYIFVTAKLGSKTLRMFLDSADLQSRVAITSLPTDFHGKNVELKVGSLDLNVERAEPSDLAGFLKNYKSVDGELGASFLSKCAVGIDYENPHSTMELWPGGVNKAAAEEWIAANSGRKTDVVDLKVGHHDRVAFTALIQNVPFEMCVDTGATATALSDERPIPKEWSLIINGSASGYGGDIQAKIYLPDFLKAGAYSFLNRCVCQVPIGANIFSPCGSGVPRVVIDFKDEKMYLPEPNGVQEDWDWALTGLFGWHFVFKNDAITIDRAYYGGPTDIYQIESIGDLKAEQILGAWKDPKTAHSVLTRLLQLTVPGNYANGTKNGQPFRTPVPALLGN
ncbi:MAG TPA: hypothetical protein VGL56_02700 [Fimbriimonadaceae bacterium]|jgi:hypothetical protein